MPGLDIIELAVASLSPLIEGNATLLLQGFAYREENNGIPFFDQKKKKKSTIILINQKEVKKRGWESTKKAKIRQYKAI